MDFYRVEPTARTSWRLAVLMGANSRTSKFALAQALLELSREGRNTVTMNELAVAYSRALLSRTNGFPEAPAAGHLGPNDFLTVLAEETNPSLALGGPTERLVDAAAASMPGMVMRKFHNLRSTGEVPHEFYRLHGRGARTRQSSHPGAHQPRIRRHGHITRLRTRRTLVERGIQNRRAHADQARILGACRRFLRRWIGPLGE